MTHDTADTDGQQRQFGKERDKERQREGDIYVGREEERERVIDRGKQRERQGEVLPSFLCFALLQRKFVA